jgi:hypothetical protein
MPRVPTQAEEGQGGKVGTLGILAKKKREEDQNLDIRRVLKSA